MLNTLSFRIFFISYKQISSLSFSDKSSKSTTLLLKGPWATPILHNWSLSNCNCSCHLSSSQIKVENSYQSQYKKTSRASTTIQCQSFLSSRRRNLLHQTLNQILTWLRNFNKKVSFLFETNIRIILLF